MVKVNTVKVINGRTFSTVEYAEKSIADKGADSLMTAQRVIPMPTYFESYFIGYDNQIVASIYNFKKNTVLSSDVWLLGNGKVRITNSDYYNSNPSLSKDGKQIYFASDRGRVVRDAYAQNSYIWRMSSVGAGGLGRIGTASFYYSSPVESPNGEKVLLSQMDFSGKQPYIWYMGRNGELPTQLQSGRDAKWISDTQIVYSGIDESTNRWSLWTMNIDGTRLTQIQSDRSLHCIQPAPSPDGKYIAFVKQNSKQEDSRDVYIYNVKSGLTFQVTTNKSRDDFPQWSQDSQHLYFRSSRGGKWNIWRIQSSKIAGE